MEATHVGRATRRVEDERLITGRGCYTDDLHVDGELVITFLRSPYAHGRIVTLDTSAARAAPGVVDVVTIEDLDAGGVRDPQPSAFNPETGGAAPIALPQPALARGRVRFAGEAVAAVVATSTAQALDALERIELDVAPLPAAPGLADALADGAPQLHECAPGNVLGVRTRGDEAATDRAFTRAAHTVGLSLVNNRVSPVTMEPRGCLAVPHPAPAGDVEAPHRLTLHMGTQGVHNIARDLAGVLAMPVEALRVVNGDVGGGFGLRLFLQGEPVVAAFAALRLGRPVRWRATRGESFLADLAGRDHLTRAELALDDDLRFIGLRVHTDSNLGAYTSQMGANIAWHGSSMATGVYDIPAAFACTRLVVSNSTPTDAYRGAGRPEASYLIERLVDHAARRLGVCPRELRRRNFVAPTAFPYASALGQRYDSGDYPRLLARGWERADGEGFPERREASARRGLRRGLGIATYVEVCAAYGREDVEVCLRDDGTVTVRVGTQSTGQGHETAYADLVAARLAIGPQHVRVLQGDTARIPTGGGTGGSRTLGIGGSALAAALDRVVDAGARMAGELLDVDLARVEFAAGQYRVSGTDRTVSLAAVVRETWRDRALPAEVAPGLRCTGSHAARGGTFPSGCHICEVEVDVETGEVRPVRYTIVDDMGRVVNPMLLEGQIVGGTAQGLSQALLEEMAYDAGSGQPLTATFADYGIVRAGQLTRIDFSCEGIPSPRNPLGVKGAGEAGTIGAPAALVNAAIDALAPLGVERLDMPLTPSRVWRAIARAAGTVRR
jgi:carbon-monoxide dehydrogenase large subunit